MAYRWRDRRRPGDIQRGHGSRGRGHIHRRAGRRLPGRSVYVAPPPPVYVAPAPVYAPPPPVYYRPAPVYVAPPVIYPAPVYYRGGGRYWHDRGGYYRHGDWGHGHGHRR